MDGKSLRAALVASLLLCVLVPASASADYNRWYLRNANTTGVHQVAFNYGDAAQTPLAGDWDADGFDTPGLFRSSTANWWLANNLAGSTDAGFVYGSPGFTPVVGDWNGNGNDTVGVKTGGSWHVSNSNSGLPASSVFTFGNPSGDIPLAGDWDGNGTETPGLYRTSNRAFYLSNSPTGSLVSGIVLGIAGDVPVVGDWNGDGKDSIGVFRSSNSGWYLSNGLDGVAEVVFAYGSPGDRPVVGDWDGNRTDTPGVVKRIAGDLYPMSTRFGGENGRIDMDNELAAFVAYADATDPATAMNGVLPADQDRVSEYLTTPIAKSAIDGPEEDPTEEDMAGWPEEDVAEASAAGGKKWKCKWTMINSEYSAGRHWFYARWCYNRTKHKVRDSGFPNTWFEPKPDWEDLVSWDIDHQKEIFSVPDDHDALVIEDRTHIKIYYKYTGRTVGKDFNDWFRVRAWWTGGYCWRLDSDVRCEGETL
jgi:hypothetical protein